MSYKKDRKVLKRVDYGAAKNSLMGVLAALLVYALVFAWGRIYLAFELESMVAGAAVLTVTAYRLWLVARFDALYGAAPARWRRMFGVGLTLHALLWGLLPAWLVWRVGPGFSFFTVVLYNVGVTTALGSSWMAGLRVRQLYILLMFLPVVITLLITGALHDWVLAALIISYGYYLFRLYRGQYETFWHAVTRERRGPLEKNNKPRRSNTDVQLSLVYRLAHELRTPMNSLMGMMSLLEDTELNDEQREYLQVAGQSGKLLLSQIDDVLDYSRILSRRITLNSDYFDFRSAIEQSLEAFGPMAQSRGLELTCVIDRLLPKRIRGDRERLMQVLTNLFSNAIKFSDEGEIRIDVDFTEESETRGVLRVRVSDQGRGMDAETLKHLFQDRFLDADDDEDLYTARHTGFGLLVCKGLIDAMGGALGADSVKEEGSTFWFTVPVQMQPDMREAQQLIRALDGAQPLVVGAASGTVASLQEEFEALDCQCSSAGDYDNALQAMRASHREQTDFNVLLVDTWSRPELALNLCRNVLGDPSLQPLKLMLLATIEERSQSSIQSLIEKHGLVVLVRPVHRSGLRQALARLMGLQRQVPVGDAPLQTPEEQKRRKRFRLLLVEDNEVNQLVTRGMLSKLGYQVKTVSNGETALALMEQEGFDLVLMDCMMPDMDGFEVTRRLREREQQEESGRTPVVAITANTAEGVQARCLAAGMDDFLGKPVHLDALETVLRRWLPDEPMDQGDEDE
ncbi:sensor histidine kinase [Alcanivorax hongdengensis A-11-3]|uniref:histidine kinase n=1 Tax=Alcanivorax hongdengensis A-11-3 TaxID=1177179 RepID=L0WBG1_9GAMM|nr:response regulator [Alcanivorax hongdengensis]EKF73070.1 sensor histidine kinase [Alcanivorax hongdengensis A-11-3]